MRTRKSERAWLVGDRARIRQTTIVFEVWRVCRSPPENDLVLQRVTDGRWFVAGFCELATTPGSDSAGCAQPLACAVSADQFPLMPG
ncbi:MAG: hypothetical protein JWL95_3254 [Gemmatimonadetes bacterium]|nr:hypothetical protein [Gemmatimonadota bacterium]